MAMGLSLGFQPRFHFTTKSSSLSSPSINSRPAIILPGLGNNSGDYKELQEILKEYGVPTVVAKVSRFDWLRNAAGLVDPNYWKGTLKPRPVLDWYLERIHDAVVEAKHLALGGSLALIGHSAGGWLARVYIEEFGASNISLLLTLGTPHLPPPKGLPGIVDQTRGLLYYVEERCCKPVESQLKYICIAGRYIQGARFSSNVDVEVSPVLPTESDQPLTAVASSIAAHPVSSKPTLRTRFVGQGYKQVCGRADVWGDGVVPQVSAHLEGALNITLDGVYHSPVGSDDELRPWYGSPAVVEQWISHLLLS